MLFEPDEAPIQSDSYIDALLDGHARRPITLLTAHQAPAAGIRHVIRVIETGLPRFHPSFLFEERLASELRAAAAGAGAAHVGISRVGGSGAYAFDRRVVMGGAIASSVSLAGAAVLAWRRRRV
jgi:hypothetical protein